LTEGKEQKKTKTEKKKQIGIVIGTIIAISAIVYIGWYEIIYDPIEVQIYFPFDNGSSRWVNMDTIIPYDFKNGTIIEISVLEATKLMDFEDFQQKIIHEKNGKVDHIYKHTDFIGSKTGNKK
jgi:hypothetical protein